MGNRPHWIKSNFVERLMAVNPMLQMPLGVAFLIVIQTISIMMTSSNGNIFRVTVPLCGEFTGPGEFPTQRPVTRSFDVLFDLRLNKRLSKQPWGWLFETPSWSLWRQRNVYWSGYGQLYGSSFVKITVWRVLMTSLLSQNNYYQTDRIESCKNIFIVYIHPSKIISRNCDTAMLVWAEMIEICTLILRAC